MKRTNAKHKRHRPMSEINVVPYIDVMLVLLVIFMIVTPLLTQGVKIDLPKAQARAIEQKDKPPLIVSVDAEGNYYLNIAADPQAPVSPVVLANRIAAELELGRQQGESPQILVKGDKSVTYDKIVTAMVLLQSSGAEKVGLITEPPEGLT